ncbi:MAG TPA: hypothetical protein VGS12_01280 [Caulobacteraceae bacterium]|nr:hypothetical protein [Caulobacteraceae bacterium]
MTDVTAPPTGGMEGGGAYNAHALLQSAGAVAVTTLLKAAAGEVALGPDERPIVLVDYGASQGRNSLAPLGAAIDVLRSRAPSDRPILTFHEDLPLNDFNALFSVLDADPGSYLRGRPNVFASAIGRSFYEPVLPANFVHLGWSAYAAMWLSAVPRTIPGHFWIQRAPREVRAEFAAQAASDWERFLGLRAQELRAGGRLVVAVPGINAEGEFGFGPVLDDANATLGELVEAGLVKAEERARMVHGAMLRSARDLLAPFSGGTFGGLTAEHCEVYAVEDVAWGDFERDGDAGALAAKRAAFFRVTYGPTLAGALSPETAPERRRAFLEALEASVQRRQTERPAPMNSFIAAIVVAKTGAAEAG